MPVKAVDTFLFKIHSHARVFRSPCKEKEWITLKTLFFQGVIFTFLWKTL